MKKATLAISLMAVLLGACSKIDPGYVGIKVNTFGSERGVEEKVLDTGIYWVGFTQTMYSYPTFAQNYAWTKSPHEGANHDESFTFQDIDGTQLNADVGMQYSIVKEKVPRLFVTYRKQIQEITHVLLHNAVRDALIKEASNYHVSVIYGKDKGKLLANAEAAVRKDFLDVGIQVDRLYWVSDIRVPDTIREALLNKNRANQIAEQKRNELAATEADAAKVVAQAEGTKLAKIKEAEGIAAHNRLINESLTPSLIQYEMVMRWSGLLPAVSGSGSPFLNLSLSDLKPQPAKPEIKPVDRPQP